MDSLSNIPIGSNIVKCIFNVWFHIVHILGFFTSKNMIGSVETNPKRVWAINFLLFHIQFKLVYPQSLSSELGTFNEVAPALNSLLELTNGGENYTIKAIFQWKLHGEIFIVTITKKFQTKPTDISHQLYKLGIKGMIPIVVANYDLVDKGRPVEFTDTLILPHL